jgi:hypothetical protein
VAVLRVGEVLLLNSDGHPVGAFDSLRTTVPPAFDTAGQRLLVASHNRFIVHHLTDAGAVMVDNGGRFSGSVRGFVGDEFALVGDALINLATGATVFRYEELAGNTAAVAIGDSVVSPQSGPRGGPQVRVRPLPGGDAVRASRNVRVVDLLAPGQTVWIDADPAIPADERVEAIDALTRQLDDRGVDVRVGSDVVLKLRVRRGEPVEIKYRPFGGGATQRHRVAPLIFEATLAIGQRVVWSDGTSTGVPMFLDLPQGQTIRGATEQQQRDSYRWFGSLQLPPRLVVAQQTPATGPLP